MTTRRHLPPTLLFAVALAACASDPVETPSGGASVTTGTGKPSTAAVGATTGSGPSATSASAGSGGGGEGGGGEGGGGGASSVSYPVPDWETADAASNGFDQALLDAAVNVAASKDSTCFLVIRHGKIVSEHYWKGHDATSTDSSWSIAKSYTSTVVGIALANGDLSSLDASVSDYVPEWKGTDKEPITIRHLLSMTSGLEWSAFGDYVTMATFTQDQTAYATDLDADKAPGTTWTYHNGGVQMFEAVFRGATGMTIDEYAALHLWSKIGSSATWKKDGVGHPTPYANVLAPCRDHARLGYLYLHGGQWNGVEVVPSAYVAEALSPSQPINRAYGFYWWLNAESPAEDAMNQPWPGRMVPFAPPDMFAARGFGNQFIDVIPSLDLMVVRFAPDPAGGQFDMGQLVADQHFEEHDAILAPVLEAIVD